MSKDNGGDYAPRAVDLTALDPHYVMPQATKDGLADLFAALDTVALLADGADQEIATPSALASLHRVLSNLGTRLMAEVSPCFSKIRETGVI